MTVPHSAIRKSKDSSMSLPLIDKADQPQTSVPRTCCTGPMEEAEYTQWVARINDLTDAQRVRASTVLTGQSGKGKASEFGDKERLLLQQLLTLRTITSDPRKPPDSKNEQEEKEEPVASMPDLWRLLPEGFQPHRWQGECLAKWFDHECRGTVKVATGGGKTLFALAAAQKLQNDKARGLRLVIVVPTIVLMNQWRDDLIKSNVPPEYIACLGGDNVVTENPEPRIIISVINSARDGLSPLVEKWGWSDRLLLVVDECHRANAPQNRRIFESRPAYTLGLSATPEVGDEDAGEAADRMYLRSPVGRGIGPIIYEYSLAQCLADGLLTQFELWNVGVTLSPEEATKHEGLSRDISDIQKDLKSAHRRSGSKQGLFAWCQAVSQRGGPHADNAGRFLSLTRERKGLLYRASSRFGLTLKILSTAMRELDRRVIVFHEEITEINRLFRTACGDGIPAVLEHSKLPSKLRDENIELFRKDIARTIISARSLVEGFNVPSADVGVISASSASERQRIQSLGRMLRKSPTAKKAVIFVLYVKGSSDEMIYELSDLEMITGATSRYFELPSGIDWDDRDYRSLDDLLRDLVETGVPPRVYRPPCNEIPEVTLVVGEKYPGQSRGLELKVDQMGNLKTSEGGLISAQHDAIDMIIATNEFRGAVRTPCGHLISRRSQDPDGTWIFVGRVGEPIEPPSGTVRKLYVKQRSGRQEIVWRLKNGDSMFALGPDKAESRDAGETRDILLRWLSQVGSAHAVEVRHFYWEGENRFYVEVHCGRVHCDESLSALEFPVPRSGINSS